MESGVAGQGGLPQRLRLDIAVGCTVGYLDFRFPQIDWRTPYPNLHKLYDKLAQRQSFVDSLPS